MTAATVARDLIIHRQSLDRYARYMCKGQGVIHSDDLVQTAAERILRHHESFTDGTDFCAWAKLIIRREFLNQVRNNRRRQAVCVNMGDSESKFTAECPGNQEDRAFLRDVLRAIRSLPPEQQTVIIGSAFGYSQEELKEVTAVALGTVKSRLVRGRQALRDLLSKKGSPRR